MKKQADIVSSRLLIGSLTKAMPQLRAMARLESSEIHGAADLLNDIESAMPLIQAQPERAGIMMTSRNKTISLLQTFLAQEARLAGKVESAPGGAFEAKFDSHDILGWFGSFFSWWKKIRPHPFLKGDAEPAEFPDIARFALLSDWGTGLYGAPHCARSIEADKEGFYMVVHLGDVYYSGDDSEMQGRFLDLWPKVDGALNRGLNGNHEMYTGGNAYFNLALQKFGQGASYFALQNRRWLVAFLDTAYDEHDLAGDQANWLSRLIANAGDRKLVLFSHHQLFSLIDVQGLKLSDKLRLHLESRRIHSWYWGHEHRCVIYDPHETWGLSGRCIGHSGFPEFRNDHWGAPPAKARWHRLNAANGAPGGYILDGQNEFIQGHETEYVPHGYVTLEFDIDRLTEIVRNADGKIVELPQASSA